MSVLSAAAASAWQLSWDRQQEGYLPDREQRFVAMLDAVEAVAGAAPSILDLAGGTGSISRRALRRFPGATTTLLDVDPVLLGIARASLDARTTIVSTNLLDPGWPGSLPRQQYDAVVTATALHWIGANRLGPLYLEIRGVLRPGGIFVNADHMPDPGLPGLTDRLGELERNRREAGYASGAAQSWEDWWGYVERDPALKELFAQRQQVFGGLHAAEFSPPVSWHLDALREAGFAEVGLVWRGSRDAAVVGVTAEPS